MRIVSGLRRSGTSLMMYALKEAGIPVLGEKFYNENPKPHIIEGNPNGYWEVDEICTKGLTVGSRKEDTIKVLFEALFKSNPNLCNKTVVMFREPRKMLNSILKHNPIDQLEVFIIINLLDTIDSLEFLKNKDYLIMIYEDILKHPVREMKKVCKFLGDGDYKKAVKTIDNKLNRSTELEGNPKNLDIMEQVYKWAKQGKIDKIIALRPQLEEEAKDLTK